MTQDYRWFWLTVIAISLFLLFLLAPILTPFIMGALLAYLGDPMVDTLEKRMPRTLAVTIVFLVTFLIVLLIFLVAIPVLETQLKLLFQRLPSYIDSAMNVIQPYMRQDLSVDMSVLQLDRLKTIIGSHWDEAGGMIRSMVGAISNSGMVLVAWVGNIALTPVIAFYMMRDWDRFITYIHDLLPRAIEPTVTRLAIESDEMLGSFLRGQLSVMLALSALYSLGLSLVGLDFAFLIGLVAGLLSFVPYLGLIIGMMIAGIAVMLQTGSPVDLGLVVLVFVVAQMIEAMLLTPMLVGEKIGLHPVTVIFSVLAGGQLFGFFGVLLALPVAAVIAVIMRHLHQSYKESQIYRI